MVLYKCCGCRVARSSEAAFRGRDEVLRLLISQDILCCCPLALKDGDFMVVVPPYGDLQEMPSYDRCLEQSLHAGCTIV